MKLLNKDAKILGQGITGAEGLRAAEWMICYGTNLIGGVTPGKGGQEVLSKPIFDSIKKAQENIGPIDGTVIFVPPLRVKDAGIEAIEAGVKFIVIVAEKVPTKDTACLYALAKQNGIDIVGPNTTGLISPQNQLKLGLMGGGEPEKMFVPGEVGVVSKSGSMTAEIGLQLKRVGLGVSWAVGIGGDRIIGTDFVDMLLALEDDPNTKVSVIFGELGGTYEEKVAEFVKNRQIKKPVVAFIGGEFTMKLPSEVQFGHAGAIIEGKRGLPSEKRRVLKEAGVKVADSLDEIPNLVKEVLNG